MLALLSQDPAKALDVGLVELTVTRWRPLRDEQAPALEETDLRDRDVREFFAEQGEHVANSEIGAFPH